MPAVTGIPLWWEEPLIAGCVVGPTWPTLGSTVRGPGYPEHQECAQSVPGPGGLSGRCGMQRPRSSSLGDRAEQQPKEAQHPLSWGQSGHLESGTVVTC